MKEKNSVILQRQEKKEVSFPLKSYGKIFSSSIKRIHPLMRKPLRNCGSVVPVKILVYYSSNAIMLGLNKQKGN